MSCFNFSLVLKISMWDIYKEWQLAIVVFKLILTTASKLCLRTNLHFIETYLKLYVQKKTMIQYTTCISIL